MKQTFLKVKLLRFNLKKNHFGEQWVFSCCHVVWCLVQMFHFLFVFCFSFRFCFCFCFPFFFLFFFLVVVFVHYFLLVEAISSASHVLFLVCVTLYLMFSVIMTSSFIFCVMFMYTFIVYPKITADNIHNWIVVTNRDVSQKIPSADVTRRLIARLLADNEDIIRNTNHWTPSGV